MEKKVKHYKILSRTAIEILHAKIDEHLENGWVLYGNPYISETNKHNQAMIKYQEENEKFVL